MTLEGCVVRVSDIIGYIGRDIEDAIRVGIIKKEDLPNNIKELLGDNNRSMINNIVNDIIKNSYNKPYIKVSDSIYKAIVDLKNFNYQNIYYKANSIEQVKQYEVMFRKLFQKYMNDLKYKNTSSDIYKVFLNYKSNKYMKNKNGRIVIDFIAGMTDDYFNREYDKIKNEKLV